MSTMASSRQVTLDIASENFTVELDDALRRNAAVNLVNSDESLDVGPVMKQIGTISRNVSRTGGPRSSHIIYSFPIVIKCENYDSD